MDEFVRLALEFGIGLVSAAAGAGVAYGSLQGRVKVLEGAVREPDGALRIRMDRMEGRIDVHDRTIGEAATATAVVASRVSDISELKASVVTKEFLEEKLSSQDALVTAGFNTVQRELLRKASVPAMEAARPAAPQPPILPAMRPRAPSRPGR